ncbi:MAG: hypothetical protein Q9217_005385 [Psora testacea]
MERPVYTHCTNGDAINHDGDPYPDPPKYSASPYGTFNVDTFTTGGRNGIPHTSHKENNGGLGNSPTEHNVVPDGETRYQVEKDIKEPIAIIGFSMRFPQEATSPDEFWKMLYQGRSAMTEIPKDRFNLQAFYHPDSSRISSINFKGGHFVKNIAAFDAPFFSITPAEAAVMDPQQRGLLEITYTALENDTSTPLTNLKFLSPDSRCYSFDHRANGYARGEGIGVIIIKRLSDALRDGDTIRTVVRASGANQDGRTPGITQPSQLAQEDLIHATYKDGGLDFGATRYFEAHGTGTAVMEALMMAIAQGDPIEAGAIAAVFGRQRASYDPLFIGAVKTNIGHLEGASGIAGVIKTIQVLEKGVIPPNIGFERPNPKIGVEDWKIKFPLEPTLWPTSGLRRASVNSFGYGGANCHVVLDDAYHYLKLRRLEGRHNTIQCRPARTKSPVLGTGGFRSDQVSKASGFGQINQAGYESLSARLPSSSYSKAAQNVATNFALVEPAELNGEECMVPDGPPDLDRNAPSHLLVWSASDEAGLRRLATSYREHDFGSHNMKHPGSLCELAYTLGSKREHFPWKSFLIADSIDGMLRKLNEGMSKPIRATKTTRLGFIFSGQGTAWHGMGRELLANPTFKTSLQTSGKYLQTLGSSIQILEQLQSTTGYTGLQNASVSQSISTATQIALVDLLRSWEIYPRIVLGHSSGEIAAAYCIGAIDKDSALRIAYYRGALAGKPSFTGQQQGAMLAVGLSVAEVEPYLNSFECGAECHDLSIGCINSPKNVTLTGSAQSVDDFQAVMKRENIFARKLDVNVAYHSKAMQHIASQYANHLQDIKCDTDGICGWEPAIMISTTSGTGVSHKQLRKPEYWVKNLVSPVRFSEVLVETCRCSLGQGFSQSWDDSRHTADQVNALLEVGPHSAMRSSVRDVLEILGKEKEVRYNSVLIRGASAMQSAMEMAGDLYCHGYPLALNEVNNIEAKTSNLGMMVDLPGYPFDHSQEYWHESRLSSNFRFRKHPRHELLGTTVSDWNPLEAKWRNFIRTSQSQWVKDHVINDSQLYPAAGMLVMALEAARQVRDEARKLKGIRIKEVTFHRAMIVPSVEEGLETNFFLRPRKTAKSKSLEWSDFRLCSYANEEWVDNCGGVVGLEYDEMPAEVDNGREARQDLTHRKQSFGRLVDRCRRPVKPAHLYDVLRSSGYNFGPTFQVLREIHCSDDNEAIAVLNRLDWHHKLPEQHLQDHLIHPTCLDGVLQITSVHLTDGGRRQISTTYPTRIENLWISADLGSTSESQKLQVSGRSVLKGFREVETAIVVMDHSVEKAQIVINGFQATALANLSLAYADRSKYRQLCFNIDWKPDLDLMDNEQIIRYCEAVAPIDTRDEEVTTLNNRDLELACIIFMADSLAKISIDDLATSSPHMQKYHQWMKRELNRHDTDDPLHERVRRQVIIHDQNYKASLFDRLERLGPAGKYILSVGRQHVGIIRGQINVMDLFFNSDLVTEYYRHMVETDPNYRRFAVYLDLLAHKNPGLNILEIGAGTGSTTTTVLDALSHPSGIVNNAARFSRYTFTDVSPAFFEKAQARFTKNCDRLEFRVLDIEKDPLQQGFESNSYDLIIAANVIHATANLNNTLQNTRNLLKPGGKLILFEVCDPSRLRVAFGFGLLSGWWLSSEENRQWSPLLREENWHETLSKNGFSGTDLVCRDHEDSLNHTVSMMISTASEKPESAASPEKIIIVASKTSPVQLQVAKTLRTHFMALITCLECAITDPQDILLTAFEQAFCLFLPELEQPYLLNMGADKLAGLQRIVACSSGILWVTQAGIGAIKPDFALVEGLSRTVQSEYRSLRFVTLAVEDPQNITRIVSAITKALSASIQSEPGTSESEYLESNRLLQINRVVEDPDMNEVIAIATGSAKPQLCQFGGQRDRSLKLTVAVPGILDTLQFVADAQVEYDLTPDEVEVRVSAYGLNLSDIMVALGQAGADYLGAESSGIVTRVGRNVGNIKPGSRVCCFADGRFSHQVRTNADLLVEIPDDLTFSSAAGIPVAYCTAYHALFNIARMVKGESVLIHSASGGFGQAAIQLAQILGTEIFVTVGAEDKKSLIMELYDIPEDHIFSSRNNTFLQGIQRMTKYHGVDVILNSLAGEGLQSSWECIAKFGRFVEIGKTDIHSHNSLPMWPFSKCATFASGDLTLMVQERKSLLGSILKAVMDLFKDKRIATPYPQHIYRIGEMLEAFRYLQSGKNTGKTIIELHDDDLVPVIPDTFPCHLFNASASYVVAGSSGGLGRSITRWMIRRGARNLILLSRSGMTSEPAAALMAELLDQKVNAKAVACDVSNAEALAGALEDLRSMPSIKGCIQGSLALKDGIFETFSLDDFKIALPPKVQGSWNLHNQLPKGMDFFILLSSVAGVTGNKGQSNYSCGNTYQDALARYRNSISERATAIDLSIVGSVGFIAERLGTEAAIQTSPEYMTIQETEFHAILDHYCNPALGKQSPGKSQLVMGIHPPTEIAAKGHDEPVWTYRSLFRHLTYMSSDKATGQDLSKVAAGDTVDVKTLLRKANTREAVEEVVCQALVQRLSKSLSIPKADIDVNKPMHRFGIDSLVAVEIRHWFGQEMKAEVTVVDILESRSVAALSSLVAGKSEYS